MTIILKILDSYLIIDTSEMSLHKLRDIIKTRLNDGDAFCQSDEDQQPAEQFGLLGQGTNDYAAPKELELTEDTAARLAAGNLRIGTHGTIGILVRAIRRRHRSKEEILALLKSIPSRTTLHLNRSLLETVISEVEGSS